MKEHFWQLTLVTQKKTTPTDSYLTFVKACLKGGVTCVQLREKSLPPEALLSFGRALKSLLDEYRVPLIVNDNVDLCMALDAFGVHLGQKDTTTEKARAILGPKKIIGLSVDTIPQAQEALTKPIDYIGVGAIFPTQNKPDIETVWGLQGLHEMALKAPFPIVAIGGINEENTLSVLKAGAQGVAAIGAFHEAEDPFLITKNLKNLIKEHNHEQ